MDGLSPPPHRRSRLTGWRAELTLAVIFLTRLPLSLRHGPDPAMHARCMGWFPLVGAGIGLAGGGVLAAALALHLPPLAGGFLALGAMALLTGALHEDGLADLADGLGGGRTRERALEIMRDSRVGSFGALALVLVAGLRAAALAAFLNPALAVAALVMGGAVSRALLPVIAWTMEPARKDGLAASQGSPPGRRVALALGLAAAVAAASAAAAGLPWTVPVLAAAAGAAGAGAVALMALRRLKGYTGDVFGAAQQVAETAVLLALAAAAAP
ncbi:adenosylcobinamide-GDP ribazoletransferase [Azospirillum fermentarium]|uniref:adenosylcobinamide-GDP ribazoletransferase n=1 Tax=Azospirillum fermentarium TaxID=1233114 RepID=UPI0022277E12|nr:adenosylcobinamide-GDP ribazoletransferase [Azospirillum fermentarium]MCW2245209.1 adenosylcobinamide-GDP ribazoletransferase [Azospirillum fermentarium]